MRLGADGWPWVNIMNQWGYFGWTHAVQIVRVPDEPPGRPLAGRELEAHYIDVFWPLDDSWYASR